MVKHSLDQLKLFFYSLDELLNFRGGGMGHMLRNFSYICELFYPNRRRKDKTQKDLREEGEGGEGRVGKGGGGGRRGEGEGGEGGEGGGGGGGGGGEGGGGR